MKHLEIKKALAIIPAGHGEYIREMTTRKPYFKESDFVAVPMIEKLHERE